jgi:hypothetical protein
MFVIHDKAPFVWLTFFGYFVPYAAALIVCIHTSRWDYTFSDMIILFLVIILK